MRYSVIMEFSTQLVYDLEFPDRKPHDDEIEKHHPSLRSAASLLDMHIRAARLRFQEFTFDTGCGIGEYKYVGVLGEKAFDKLLHDWCLDGPTEDGATVGAPGLGYALVPSITFRTEEYDYRIEVTVTPIPTKREEKKFTYKDVVKRIHALAA